MNLQEALNYRQNCLICQRPLKMTIPRHTNLSISIHEGGLRIKSGHKAGIMMLFGFDGTFQRNKRDYSIYHKPLEIWLGCHVCLSSYTDEPISCIYTNGNIIHIHKNRSAGYTTKYMSLENLKNSGCLFTFMLHSNSSMSGYELQPLADLVRYCDGEAFYHWTTYFDRNTTKLESGKFFETLDDMFSLTVPSTSLAGTHNKDEFLKKFKLYTLFS